MLYVLSLFSKRSFIMKRKIQKLFAFILLISFASFIAAEEKADKIDEIVKEWNKSAASTDSLEIKNTSEKGRGVFAKRDFSEGEIIEHAPVIVIPTNEEPSRDMVLYNYTFGWGKDFKQSALALGYGSLYNHSKNPNAYWILNEKNLEINFIAKRAIKAEEEITISYNGNFNSNKDTQNPLWFDPVE